MVNREERCTEGVRIQPKSGDKCQAWSAQTPHEHDIKPDTMVPQGEDFEGKKQPDKPKYPSLSEVSALWTGERVKIDKMPHNFCRDPDHRGHLWCFTENKDKRIGKCSKMPMPSSCRKRHLPYSS